MALVTASNDALFCSAAELRLRKHAEFQRVYNATKKQHAKQMSYFAAARAVAPGEYAGPRVGLTVGKVMGKAHVRNRIKRRLREALRAEHASLGGLAVDVVLHPRRTVETLPMEELRAEVAWVFRRVRKLAVPQTPLQGVRGGDTAGRPQGGRKTHLSREERGEGGARSSLSPDRAAE